LSIRSSVSEDQLSGAAPAELQVAKGEASGYASASSLADQSLRNRLKFNAQLRARMSFKGRWSSSANTS
jgi:hypothetical protein